MPSLEERLIKRLRSWRAAARQHRECLDELNDDSDEYWMHKVEAEVFERVMSEIATDLMASLPRGIMIGLGSD